YSYLKTDLGVATTKGGRRRLRLFACASCRCLLWHLPLKDPNRRALEAAEAFADGLIDRAGLEAARAACRYSPFRKSVVDVEPLNRASNALLEATAERAASAAYNSPRLALGARLPMDRPEQRKRLCHLLRDIFGSPTRPLARRAFPAHVVELARECYSAFPAASNRFL